MLIEIKRNKNKMFRISFIHRDGTVSNFTSSKMPNIRAYLKEDVQINRTETLETKEVLEKRYFDKEGNLLCSKVYFYDTDTYLISIA